MPQVPVDFEIERVRVLLAEPVVRGVSPWATLGAAALAATAAVLMAGVMVLGPGIALEDQPSGVETRP